MDDPYSVGGVESIGNFDGQREDPPVSIGRPAIRCFSVIPSRYSIAIKDWSSCFADFVDRANVRMVQGGSGTASRRKRSRPAGPAPVHPARTLRRQSDQARCPRPCRPPHAAAAEFLDDAVVRDDLTDHAQGCYGGSIPKSMKAVELGGARLRNTLMLVQLRLKLYAASRRAVAGSSDSFAKLLCSKPIP